SSYSDMSVDDGEIVLRGRSGSSSCDARSPSSYQTCEIPGASGCPPDELARLARPVGASIVPATGGCTYSRTVSLVTTGCGVGVFGRGASTGASTGGGSTTGTPSCGVPVRRRVGSACATGAVTGGGVVGLGAGRGAGAAPWMGARATGGGA